MSKQRMAGEAMKDPNFQARTRLSNDPKKAAERASKVGSNYDVTGYSDKEISMALMGSKFGDEDYSRLTGKPMPKDEDNTPVDTNPTPTPTTEPTDPPTQVINDPPRGVAPLEPGPYTGSSQTQNINQDNDIFTTISGNNNTVSNFQDNSISQSMGGDYGSRYARGLKDQYVLNLLNR